jgi:hypothetical protein
MTEPATPSDAPRTAPEPVEETWPHGLPYTVQFPDGDGAAAADLEYPAHLPRVGDSVEYIDERGQAHRYRVREVIHTFQSSATGRPTVGAGNASPDSLARPDPNSRAERPGEAGQIRAGLPKVILEAAS